MSENVSPDDLAKQKNMSDPTTSRDSTSFPSQSEQPNNPKIDLLELSWRGPLPPPDVLRMFGEIDPNFPHRIMDHMEREQQHRHDMERASLDAEKEIVVRGHRRDQRVQWMAFVLTLLLIATGVGLTLGGHEAVAFTIFGTTIAAVATVFIVGRLTSR